MHINNIQGATMFKNKGITIIHRKTITDTSLFKEFEKAFEAKLPDPAPVEEKEWNQPILRWVLDLNIEQNHKEFQRTLDFFELPYKTCGADKVFCKISRDDWNTATLEIHAWDETYEVMSQLGYI
jgi:hypothetical protein